MEKKKMNNCKSTETNEQPDIQSQKLKEELEEAEAEEQILDT